MSKLYVSPSGKKVLLGCDGDEGRLGDVVAGYVIDYEIVLHLCSNPY